MELQRVLEEETIKAPDAFVPPAAATATATQVAATRRVQLWDLPIRVFHWSLLAAVSTAIVTGKLGGEWMEVHGKAGLAIVGLLSFRVVWGFLGSTHARFTQFVPSPAKILAYLQGRWKGIGHNPLGALSVLGLLFVLGVQAGTGLFSNDDIAFTGPLASLVEEALSYKLTSWHHQLVNVIFVLLGLHVAAIAFYVAFKKDNLVKPMVTGWKEVSADIPTPRRGKPIALIASILIASGAVYAANGTWAHNHQPAAVPATEASAQSTATGNAADSSSATDAADATNATTSTATGTAATTSSGTTNKAAAPSW